MDCLHPLSIDNPDYGLQSNVKKIFVPCGKCESCIISNANEWRVRLQIEREASDVCYFVTLTYDDAHLPIQKCTDSFGDSIYVPVVCKRDVQLFFKRLRKLYSPYKIRYFLVSEYGPTTFRPHYHLLLFGIPRSHQDNELQTVKDEKRIREVWSNGNVMLDPVTDGRISYVTKYLCCTISLPEYLPKPFRLMSRRPGIGSIYLDNSERIEWHRKGLNCFYPIGKFKHRLPRFLQDKIFDDDMKFQIKEKIEDYRNNKLSKEIEMSKILGFSNVVDFKEQQLNRLIDKFNDRYRKTRKN